MQADSISYVTECDVPIELIPVAADPSITPTCPPRFRSMVVVDTVHDGNFIPARILTSPSIRRLQEDGTLWRHYVAERDWGANSIASKLAIHLGLEGYYRVNVARVVMDFNRFPGSTLPGSSPLDRLAINPPLAQHLSHEDKSYILEAYYDAISTRMESAIAEHLIKLSIHTYDEHNVSRTQRPEVSLLTRSLSYQQNSHLPFGLFDPMFPDVVAESCATRILRDRIALTLEKAGIVVEHNYPYCLPDGSLEIRSQVWFFFRHLRHAFEAAHPDTRGNPVYERVWDLLGNTNLRNGSCEAFFGYLHRFRRAAPSVEAEFRQSRGAYEAVRQFLDASPRLTSQYRMSTDRPSSISIEIRKDLLNEFDQTGAPARPIEPRGTLIATKLAEAIGQYLTEDRPTSAR